MKSFYFGVGSDLAVVDVETQNERHGVSARELLALRPKNRRWITATAIETWLLREGFAETNGAPGRLVPTALAFEIAGDLRFIG